MKAFIPNALTMGNLLMGCLGILATFHGELLWASYAIFIAAVFDFLDGMAARLLNVSGELGKQLDSLADAVTFGVLPGFIQFHWISIGLGDYFTPLAERTTSNLLIASIAFLIPVFAVLRLAKFNIDTRQNEQFIGLPTPAMALFTSSWILIIQVQYHLNPYMPVSSDEGLAALLSMYRWWQAYDFHLVLLMWNPLFHVITSLILCALMVSPLPLLSFKFKSLNWQKNKNRYLFLILVLVCFVLVALPYQTWFRLPLPYLDYSILPIILLLYLIYSTIIYLTTRKHEIPGGN